MVAFAFYPKILERWWEPMNDILSVCECSLSSTLIRGRDTQILTAEVKLFTLRGGGDAKTLLLHSCVLSHPCTASAQTSHIL